MFAGSAIALTVLSAFLGLPLFCVLGLLAVITFRYISEIPIQALVSQVKMLIEAPGITALPLFTLMGYVLSASKTSERLAECVQKWIGWLPGGLAMATVIAYTGFSAITGGSAVAVMALGGIYLAALTKAGYGKNFSLGVCTVCGGEGMLFPPSLPIIVLGIVAHQAIGSIYYAALLPGLFVVLMDCLYSFTHAVRHDIQKGAFSLKEALKSTAPLIIEAPLPLFIILGIVTPWFNITEVAAICLAYTIMTQTLIRREVGFKEMGESVVSSMSLIGAIFTMILVALAFSSFLIDAQLPDKALEFMRGITESRVVFLIVLNVILLITGCLMDVFSAALVMVPILLPIAEGYGIHPLHFCIIFIWNLEIGYTTPPFGFNLFIGSFRFKEPVETIFRAALPRLGIQLISLLVITFIPELSLWLVRTFNLEQSIPEMI